MKIELWTIYFDPVPMGIGPVAGILARQLQLRGHEVTVVTSHPHYPGPDWGTSWRTKRRSWHGVKVVELPVYTRRQSPMERAFEELTYFARHTFWALRRSEAEVIIATVPSLMCVPGAVLQARLRRKPLVVWLQDVVSEAAGQTGLSGGTQLAPILAKLERAAFRAADRTVVISQAFRRHLISLGIHSDRIERVFLGSPEALDVSRPNAFSTRPPVVVVIGNIGLTQGLAAFVREFQESVPLAQAGARLKITGEGVATSEVLDAINTDRVEYLGVVSRERLEAEIRGARLGLVTQAPGVKDFNLPSKTVTYMAAGLPVFAIADPDSELSELVCESGAGRAASNLDLSEACDELARFVTAPAELEDSASAAVQFARKNFDPDATTAQFESVLSAAVRSKET